MFDTESCNAMWPILIKKRIAGKIESLIREKNQSHSIFTFLGVHFCRIPPMLETLNYIDYIDDLCLMSHNFSKRLSINAAMAKYIAYICCDIMFSHSRRIL